MQEAHQIHPQIYLKESDPLSQGSDDKLEKYCHKAGFMLEKPGATKTMLKSHCRCINSQKRKLKVKEKLPPQTANQPPYRAVCLKVGPLKLLCLNEALPQ